MLILALLNDDLHIAIAYYIFLIFQNTQVGKYSDHYPN